jgi:hypothetical protein
MDNFSKNLLLMSRGFLFWVLLTSGAINTAISYFDGPTAFAPFCAALIALPLAAKAYAVYLT